MYTLLIVSCIGCLFIAGEAYSEHKEHEISLRIINGQEAAEREAPYFVTVRTYLIKGGNLVEFCGGTILSKNYILTAAHCLPNVTYYEVIAGTHLLSNPNKVFRDGTKFTIHSQYVPPPLVHYDLAILELSTPLDFSNPYVQVTRLPTRTEAKIDHVGDFVRIFGRGDTSDSQPPGVYTDELRYLVAKVIPFADCKKNFDSLYSGNICTGGSDRGKNIGGCKGDSGGPLMHIDVQIGVVSYGGDFCETGEPTVYSDLGQFLDWIAANSDVTVNN